MNGGVIRGKRATRLRADPNSAIEFSLSESGQRPNGTGVAIEGSGGCEDPAWVSTLDRAFATGGLEGECQAAKETLDKAEPKYESPKPTIRPRACKTGWHK
jgi:hypothetical protein